MNKIIVFASLLIFFLSAHPVFGAPPTLSDYWEGKAVWVPAFTIPGDGTLTGPWKFGSEASVQIIVIDKNWYLFDRHVDWSDSWKTKNCPQTTMTLEVRKSTDTGKTWSEPVDILSNAVPYQACNAVDGGVFYQAATNTWHILYQCLGPGLPWQGCHATRIGNDPLGPFIPDPLNPVIKSGSLWSKICNSPTDKCVSQSTGSIKPPVDEGTWDIFNYDGQYYWVSFHGFDGKNGFRGIAKTIDFHTWIAGDLAKGVPSDAVLSPSDATNWNVNWAQGGPVGFGTSRMLKDGDYWYQLAEAMDINLAVVGTDPTQHWDDGIFRSKSLTSTSWEQPINFRNPVIYTDESLRTTDLPAVFPVYSGIFRDQNRKIYMHYSRSGYDAKDTGIFFFTLEYTNQSTSPSPIDKQADLNNDGKVDIFDYNIMVANFGHPYTIFDYNVLVGNFGK
jgi:hypothetical protein